MASNFLLMVCRFCMYDPETIEGLPKRLCANYCMRHPGDCTDAEGSCVARCLRLAGGSITSHLVMDSEELMMNYCHAVGGGERELNISVKCQGSECAHVETSFIVSAHFSPRLDIHPEY